MHTEPQIKQNKTQCAVGKENLNPLEDFSVSLWLTQAGGKC